MCGDCEGGGRRSQEDELVQPTAAEPGHEELDNRGLSWMQLGDQTEIRQPLGAGPRRSPCRLEHDSIETVVQDQITGACKHRAKNNGRNAYVGKSNEVDIAGPEQHLFQSEK